MARPARELVKPCQSAGLRAEVSGRLCYRTHLKAGVPDQSKFASQLPNICNKQNIGEAKISK